ncbi:MAG: ABC transporter substrate-binding protein [Ruminococcus sp.]|nr:ABC transporter substrate-binding protein [Ruminococcus sp.]
MKKHLVLIVNIILILAVLGGIFFAITRASKVSDTAETTAVETIATEQAVPTEPTTPQEIYNIGIIQHSNVENSNSVYQGFLNELADKGYVNNKNIVLDYVLEEDNDKCKEAIQNFIDDDYDLIFTIGPFATKLAASMTTEIPIVFAAVQEPDLEEFVNSNEAPGRNVTGVSDYTPCFEQIDSIKLMFPDTKKIGAIYLGTNQNAVTQALIGEKEAQTEHVNIDYVKYPITSAKEINSTLDTMLKDGVEVIYTPVDGFINKNISPLIDFSYKNKIPVVCGNLTMLEKGCFSTSVINYPSIGGAAADIMLDILVHDADPATTPIVYIYDCYLHINEKAMKELGIKLSDEILETAIIE